MSQDVIVNSRKIIWNKTSKQHSINLHHPMRNLAYIVCLVNENKNKIAKAQKKSKKIIKSKKGSLLQVKYQITINT